MIADYAHKKGYTLQQYNNLQLELKVTAKNILEIIKEKYNPGSGIYYPIDEILSEENEYKYLIVYELKKLHVEFFDNTTMFRF